MNQPEGKDSQKQKTRKPFDLRIFRMNL